MSDFSKEPETIGERRSDDGNAAKWAPRDALIAMLRDIDAGVEKPDALVIAYRTKVGVGATTTGFRSSSPDIHTTLGLLEAAKLEMYALGQ